MTKPLEETGESVERYENHAIREIDAALHFWADDWWDITCETDTAMTCTHHWYGTVLAKPVNPFSHGKSETFFLVIGRDGELEAEFELAEDMFASITSENIYMFLYFQALQSKEQPHDR